MAGLIRVRSIGDRRRRAGLAFSREWSSPDGTLINEAQFLAILEDDQLIIEFAADAEAPEWKSYPGREEAIAVLRDHITYDIAHGRPHDKMIGREADSTEFQSAEGGEGRTAEDASSAGALEPKDGTGTDDFAAPSADPQGGEDAAAVSSQESREGTDDDAAAQDAASAGEKEPEESLQPPVAASEQEQAGDEAPATKRAGSRRRQA